MFPNSRKFKYEYQKNKPWQYEDLKAPFSFPIYKSGIELDNEYEGIRKGFKPFFSISKGVHNKVKDKFRKELGVEQDTGLVMRRSKEKQVLNTSENLLAGLALITDLYRYGIYGESEVLKGKRGNYEITIVDGKYADERPLSSFIKTTAVKDSLNAWVARRFPDMPQEVVDIIAKQIEPDVFYENDLSTEYKSGLEDDVSITQGLVSKDEVIVRRGNIVNNEVYQKLESLRMETEKQYGDNYSSWAVSIGQAVVISMALMLLVLFLWLFRKEMVRDNARFSFLFFIIILMVFTCWVVLQFDELNIYLVPFCIVTIIIRAFFDTRVALYTHLITVLVVGFVIPNSFEFVFLQLAAGIIALFSIVGLKKRGQLIIAAVMVFGMYALGYTGIEILHEGSFDNLYLKPYVWFAGSSLLLLFAYPSIFIFEKLFGFTSDVRLLELADTNSPLLKELALKAPGTFQHSLQVANLAEAAIDKIGGESLLVRTGALYHDIGKMEMPLYFIENQVEGVNPHDSIEFDQSAHIIVNHVARGIELAKKNRLPQQIIDFIETHHGTTRVQYFYNSYIKKFPDRAVDLELFSYPGPKPFSKETAVLMMADSVEAASRSLKSKDPESLNNLVDTIIHRMIEDEQFNESDITLKDIDVARRIFKKMLGNMYHARIEYPK
jgi:putative nucleotidyltransferase with HDIG domain